MFYLTAVIQWFHISLAEHNSITENKIMEELDNEEELKCLVVLRTCVTCSEIPLPGSVKILRLQCLARSFLCFRLAVTLVMYEEP